MATEPDMPSLCMNVEFSVDFSFLLKMNKRPVNDAAFSIQGVNRGLNARDEANTTLSPQTNGRVICEKLFLRCDEKMSIDFSFFLDNNFSNVRIY